MAPKKVLPPDGTPVALLWVDEWDRTWPFQADLMESRTAFVRAEIRAAHIRRSAADWQARWTEWRTRTP